MRIRPHEGLQIDGFTLGRCLHTGGFATIWDVTHPLYRTPLVMKVPTILDGYDGPTIVGFEVEQMIMPRLTGPHVPRVVAEGDFATMPYIVTERIPGDSFLQLFKSAPAPVEAVVALAAGITSALHELHKQHVIHLDLKPANLLRRTTGEVVFVDFGLARHDHLPDLLSEEFRIPMGTFPYIAPEQYLKVRDDLRSDLFAVGAILYEYATGRQPFGEPKSLKGVRKRLWRDPVPPRALNPEIPPWLQEIILKALEVDPKNRFQSAAQMLFDLQHPAQVKLTERAEKTAQDSFGTVFRRWRQMRRVKSFGPPPANALAQMDKAPILLVAVDLSPEMEELARRLLQSVQRLRTIQPDARVACVNVIKTARLGVDRTTDDEGVNLHVSRLVALRAWASSLELEEGEVTFTILEGSDPAAEIITYAVNNQVDHILMGARGSSSTRRFLGSVSSQVVAEAPCSVTVVRIPAYEAVPPAEEGAEDGAEEQDRVDA